MKKLSMRNTNEKHQNERLKNTIQLGRMLDVILPRKGLVTRAMSKRLQGDWARAAEEGTRVLMNLRVDF